jgi:hypothetical protein
MELSNRPSDKELSNRTSGAGSGTELSNEEFLACMKQLSETTFVKTESDWISQFDGIEEKASVIFRRFESLLKFGKNRYLYMPGGDKQSRLHVDKNHFDVIPVATVSTIDDVCRLYIDHPTGITPKGLSDIITNMKIPKAIKSTDRTATFGTPGNDIAYRVAAVVWNQIKKARAFGRLKTGDSGKGTWYWFAVTDAYNSNGTKMLNRYKL